MHTVSWSSMVGCGVQLAAQGVDTERVDLMGLHPDTGSHLASYAALDIALDPWPYAGTTTTAEALLMGVPLVTLAGGSSHGTCCCKAALLWITVAWDAKASCRLNGVRTANDGSARCVQASVMRTTWG